MVAIISLEDAQSRLKELIGQLAPGEEIVIADNQRPVARLIAEPEPQSKSPRPGPGICKGAILYMAPDFDAPLEDMKEYME